MPIRPRSPLSRRANPYAACLIAGLVGCGMPSTPDESTSSGAPDGGDATGSPTGRPAGGHATGSPDAGVVAPANGDGTPVREPCVESLASGLTTAFGRLDGYLVAVLSPGHHGCHSDSDHIHLQVKVSGKIYDIAITAVDTNGSAVDFLERDLALPDGAWSEGWHTNVHLDYTQLGLHDADFTATSKADLTTRVEHALQTANHVSIFATGYSDRTGAHKVHRNGGGADGALIIDPTAATSHALLFHFETQRF